MLREVLLLVLLPFLYGTGTSPIVAQELDYAGRPVFQEGTDRGYYVWREGDQWHVRWTTRGSLRLFTGRVQAEGGKLRSLKRIDVEKERRIVRPGTRPRVVRGPRGRVRVAPGRPPVTVTREQDHIDMDGDRMIRFLARTDDDIDGFDFKVDSKVRSLRFVLEIDGQSRAGEVEIGRYNRHPAQNPFDVEIP